MLDDDNLNVGWDTLGCEHKLLNKSAHEILLYKNKAIEHLSGYEEITICPLSWLWRLKWPVWLLPVGFPASGVGNSRYTGSFTITFSRNQVHWAYHWASGDPSLHTASEVPLFQIVCCNSHTRDTQCVVWLWTHSHASFGRLPNVCGREVFLHASECVHVVFKWPAIPARTCVPVGFLVYD